MKFVWDEDKNIANQEKHGVSFEEASEIFHHDFEVEYDAEHSDLDEDRFIAYGEIEHHGYIMVVHTEVADEVYRIISARRA